MSDKFINPLKEFEKRIVRFPSSFPYSLINKLQACNIILNETEVELGKKESWINWRQYHNHYSFYFDFDNNESVIKGWLRSSKLKGYSCVIMEFGYQAPVSVIPMDVFIDYCYELVIIAGYESVVLTEDGKLFMEFIRRDYSLKSNFLIKPSS